MARGALIGHAEKPATKFGTRIREIRKRLKMTQWEFAAALGTSQGVVSNMELGRAAPSIQTIGKVCEVGKTRPAEFFREFSAADLKYLRMRF